MGSVYATFGQDIDPEIFQHKRSLAQIKSKCFGKGGNVNVQRLFHRLEDREPPGEVTERCIGRVAGITLGLAPFLPGFIILCDGITGGGEFIRVDRWSVF